MKQVLYIDAQREGYAIDQVRQTMTVGDLICYLEGATDIDCVVVHIENPQDEKALNIALNKAVGEWEPVALADLLSDLQQSGYDLGATGFDAAEVDDLFSKVHDKNVKDDDCDIDPEAMQPFVQPGDVWTLGRHRMACEQTDRICHTMELDPRYASVIVMRYAAEYGSGGIFVLRDGQKIPFPEVTSELMGTDNVN